MWTVNLALEPADAGLVAGCAGYQADRVAGLTVIATCRYRTKRPLQLDPTVDT